MMTLLVKKFSLMRPKENFVGFVLLKRHRTNTKKHEELFGLFIILEIKD